jgi:hypothetical protein
VWIAGLDGTEMHGQQNIKNRATCFTRTDRHEILKCMTLKLKNKMYDNIHVFNCEICMHFILSLNHVFNASGQSRRPKNVARIDKTKKNLL